MRITTYSLVSALDDADAAAALGTLWPLKLLTEEELDVAIQVVTSLTGTDLERALGSINREEAEREALVSLRDVGPIAMLLGSAYQFLDAEGLSNLAKTALNGLITRGKSSPDAATVKAFTDIETELNSLPPAADATDTILKALGFLKALKGLGI